MEEDLEQKIVARLAELPDDVRAAVESGDVPTHVQAIGVAHGLHVDQIGLLEDATMLVMLGFASPDEFVGDITEQLHLPTADAAAIAGEVSEQLFVPIRESMQAFMEQRAATTAPEERHELPLPAAPETRAAPGTTPNPAPAVSTPQPAMPQADTMLTQKTVSAPVPQTPAPATYKTDPYREPPE